MPGGKGPASPSGGDGFVSGNLGLIALFAGVVVIFAGIVAASQVGLFSGDGGGASGEVLSCEETFIGQTVHEHANIEVYLASDQPVDFSQERYQLADQRLHFEGGDGRTIHVHEARPTLGCLFQTLGWTVTPNKIVTDQGETYKENGGEIRILVNGEPAERGFNTPIQQGDRFTVRYTETAGGNESGTNAS